MTREDGERQSLQHEYRAAHDRAANLQGLGGAMTGSSSPVGRR